MVEPGAFFEVADGELDDGVGAVELISGGGVVVGVGDERVVSPVGPHLLLGALGESGAAHHEANGALGFAAAGDVLGLGDLGAAALGVGDVGPGVVADRLDRCAHSGSERDGDRPLDVVGVEAVDQLWDQNPESARTVVGPVAPARRRLATSSSTNRTTPRAEPAEPLRMRAASTSRVSARAASSG